MKEFTVPGEPRGKQRPRMTKRGVVYTPTETTAYERKVRFYYVSKYGGKKLEGPVNMTVTAVLGIPTSATKKARLEMETGETLPTKKPDVDNILKIVMDGLTGAAYDDDKQVVSAAITKRYGIEPRVIVQLEEADHGWDGIIAWLSGWFSRWMDVSE